MTTAPSTIKFKIKPSATESTNDLELSIPTNTSKAVAGPAPEVGYLVPVAKATDPMAMLLKTQMENFVQKMAADGTLTGDGQSAALAQVAEMMSTIQIPAAPVRKRTKKEIPSDCRCMARVWGSGMGTQCSHARKPGCGDYCRQCHKKAQVTTEALQFDDAGKHIGLFWGRFDEPKPIMSGGYVTVQWKDPSCAEKVTKALADGAKFHPHSGEAKKKVKGPRKPRGAKKSKSKKPKARRTKNAFFHFLGETRQAKKAELIAAAAEGEKIGVGDVTKALGAIWKTMDEAARAPYVALEQADKAKAQAELEASMATIDTLPLLEETAAGETTVNTGLGDDEVGQILAQGLNGINTDVPDDNDELDSMINDLGETANSNDDMVDGEDDDDEEGEEVDEHTLADGRTFYLSSDGTLYDMETQAIVGTHNVADNSLISA